MAKDKGNEKSIREIEFTTENQFELTEIYITHIRRTHIYILMYIITYMKNINLKQGVLEFNVKPK